MQCLPSRLVPALHGGDRGNRSTATAMVGAEIERLLREAFPEARIVVVDLAGDGAHFAVRVTAAVFRDKSRVQQHKMVYDALQGQMGGDLHALAIETTLPP